jgi:ATP-binding cassette subfamily A (ABC1) protein 3
MYSDFLNVFGLFYSSSQPHANCILFSQLLSSGQLGSLGSLILFFPKYLLSSRTSPQSRLLAYISGPIAFSDAFAAITSSEMAKTGITFQNWHGTANTPIGFNVALLFMAIDIAWCLLLAFYLDQVVPTEHGSAKVWNFCCQRSFMFSNSDIEDQAALMNSDIPMEPMGQFTHIEPVSEEIRGRGNITIKHLRKEFDRSSCGRTTGTYAPLIAIDDLDVQIYEGEIFALLGHNGAGKSTTISVLTGMLSASAGDVRVLGKSVATDMDEIRRSVGYCPQHDILFEKLTVNEHLEFYATIKGVSADDLAGAIREKLVEVGLEEKSDAFVETLSGGQKRKLSVCIALIGNSRVVYCDEPTSGLDPVSARQIWALLKRYRRGRILVLTTHDMNEADLLADRVAILSKGRLKCCGSSLFLKNRFGQGYQLTVEKLPDCLVDQVIEMVSRHIPPSKMLSNVAKELSFVLPFSQVDRFADLFSELEDRGGPLNIASYGISMTTLDEVFLSIAHREEHEATGIRDAVELKEEPPQNQVEYSPVAIQADETDFPPILPRGTRASACVQLQAMMFKRLIIIRRDVRSLFFQLFFPVMYVVFALWLLSKLGASSLVTLPNLQLTAKGTFLESTLFSVSGTVGCFSLAMNVCQNLPSFGFTPLPISPGSSAETTIYTHLLTQATPSYAAAVFQSLTVSNASVIVDQLLLLNNSAVHAAPVALAALASSIFSFLRLPGSLTFVNSPLPYHTDNTGFSILATLLVPLLVGIAHAYVLNNFGFAVVKERSSKSKHQQFVMGVRPWVFWAANLVSDLLLTLVPTCLYFILFASFGQTSILGANLLPATLLFVISSFSSLCFNYVLSFFFDKFTSMVPVAVLFNILFGMIFAAATLLLSLAYPTKSFVQAMPNIGPVVPTFSVFYGLFKLTSLITNNDDASFQDSFSSLGNLLWLTFIYGFAYFAIILAIEYDFFSKIYRYFCFVL